MQVLLAVVLTTQVVLADEPMDESHGIPQHVMLFGPTVPPLPSRKDPEDMPYPVYAARTGLPTSYANCSQYPKAVRRGVPFYDYGCIEYMCSQVARRSHARGVIEWLEGPSTIVSCTFRGGMYRLKYE